jgi:hypothetical protein
MTAWPVVRYPTMLKTSLPMSTPMTGGDTVLDSIFGFIAASPADRLLPLKASAVGKAAGPSQ